MSTWIEQHKISTIYRTHWLLMIKFTLYSLRNIILRNPNWPLQFRVPGNEIVEISLLVLLPACLRLCYIFIKHTTGQCVSTTLIIMQPTVTAKVSLPSQPALSLVRKTQVEIFVSKRRLCLFTIELNNLPGPFLSSTVTFKKRQPFAMTAIGSFPFSYQWG